MKTFGIAMAAALAATAVPVAAQAWQSINQRQASLDARIDAGVRSGALKREEAILLRGEFRTLAALEARYRATGGGLSTTERRDLDQRFDRLSAKTFVQKHDAQTGNGWLTINQRQRALDARIDAGVRNRTISAREAILLRGEFRTLATLETRYRQTGNSLTLAERQDLDRRFDTLSRKVSASAATRI